MSHDALAEAIESDHPCTDSACDIRAALEQGYPHVAAWLLCSATDEHAEVTRTLAQGFDTLPNDLKECDDWSEWKRYHEVYSRECPSCGAFNYADDWTSGGKCGNCLADIPGDSIDPDYEYSVRVPMMYVAGDEPVIDILINAVGGGTVREAYADNGWEYDVRVNGESVISGSDIRSNATPGTHESMARTLANFLSAAGESLHRSGDDSEYAAEHSGAAREFLEGEYERLSLFGMDEDESN